MKGKFDSSLLYLLVVMLVIGLALASLFPRRVVSAAALPDKFSGDRALAHLPIIAREPHPSGSPAQSVVRDYLVQQLTDLGLNVEVQQTSGVENVVARQYGTDPSGAILLQAHYDSYNGPGAADNGAGVAAILEVMRALTSGPKLLNDVIVLFDDSEEMPDAFTGTKAFIRKHPWMADVHVAIGLDTAARGFISVLDTGPDNGWMVDVLARSYTGGLWTSLSGGGTYDTRPFRDAGVRVLELEDNYPFHEQHTPDDVPEIVNPGTVQQLGEQTLAVVRELGQLDLNNTRGEQHTYMYVPGIGLAHYPEAWSLPFAILAGILMLIALGLSLWRHLATWRGLGVAFVTMVIMAGLAGFGVNAIWKAAPNLLDWETHKWSEWPEVIPPNGWWILVLSNLIVLILAVVVYKFARRWSSRTNFSLVGLLIFLLLAVGLAIAEPRGAITFTWPVLLGSIASIAAVALNHRGDKRLVDVCILFTAIPTIIYILPLVPATFMSDGTKSVAIMAGVWVIILWIILPAVDDFLMRPVFQSKEGVGN